MKFEIRCDNPCNVNGCSGGRRDFPAKNRQKTAAFSGYHKKSRQKRGIFAAALDKTAKVKYIIELFRVLDVLTGMAVEPLSLTEAGEKR